MTANLWVRLAVVCGVANLAGVVLFTAGDKANSQPGYAAPAQIPAATYGLAPAPGGMSAADGKKIVDKLDRLDDVVAELREIKAALAGKVSQTAPKLSLLDVAKAACGKCHTPANAKGDFILFLDESRSALAPFTPRQKQKMWAAVESGDMPQGGPELTPAQKEPFKALTVAGEK